MEKALLVTAINKMKVVVLNYHGYSRSVEPHCLGEGKKGATLLRCWQTSGGSLSNDPVGWKLLEVSEIHSASMSDTSFSSARPGYKRGDTAMQHIYAQI